MGEKEINISTFLESFDYSSFELFFVNKINVDKNKLKTMFEDCFYGKNVNIDLIDNGLAKRFPELVDQYFKHGGKVPDELNNDQKKSKE